jgi:hypothetical protein
MTERKNAPSNPRYNDGVNWPFLFSVLITGNGPLLIFSDFNLNHDIYANSSDIIPDVGLILRNSQHPPDVRGSRSEKVLAEGRGTYWRYRLSGAK